MKSITCTRRFDETPERVAEGLRRVLSLDKTVTPSWSSDGRRVAITFDRRNTWSFILDARISEDGSVAITGVSPSVFSFTQKATGKLIEALFDQMENEMKRTQPSLANSATLKADVGE
jgi:hypothetical protein